MTTTRCQVNCQLKYYTNKWYHSELATEMMDISANKVFGTDTNLSKSNSQYFLRCA